jgi:hypothetical protein
MDDKPTAWSIAVLEELDVCQPRNFPSCTKTPGFINMFE